MAQARPPSKGGFTAVHAWMIGFVFLWLTVTVLLVWLYTDQEGLRKDMDDLRARNDQLNRSKNDVDRHREETAMLAIGEEGIEVDDVRAKITAVLNQIVEDAVVEDTSVYETAALLPATSALYEDFKGERSQRLAAEARATDAETSLGELVDAHAALKDQFDQATAAIKGQVDEIESSRATYAANRDKEVDDFSREMDETRQRHSRDAQNHRNTLAAEVQRREELEARHATLQDKVGELQIKPGALLTLRSSDGEVVLARPGDRAVYIGLGEAHHLTSGLQFAVYPAAGIPADGRAKARIEVTRIHEKTAECEVVWLDEAEVIVVGDVVANPVYDPSKPLKFLVVGEFDMDSDGRDDPHGADQIKGMIREWGGEVLDALSSRIDFVVAGYAPVAPPTVVTTDRTRDAGAEERERLHQRRLSEHNQLVASAQELSIPILTQDVLLRFLGY